MPLFQRRHYEQLAYWAGTNLDLKTLPSLLDFLANDNPAFQKSRFVDACKTHRALAASAHAAAAAAAAMGFTTCTDPKPIEANLDAIVNSD